MSHSIHPATSVGRPAASTNHASPKDDSVRSLAIRRVELACFARHLDRQRRRHQEQEEHLKFTRKQVDALLERSRQQVAHIQANSPERIAELEKALTHAKGEATRLAREKASQPAQLEQALKDARGELDLLRRAEARLATEKSGLEAKLPALEKALAQARNDLEAQRRDAGRMAELEQALREVCTELESRREEVARMAADKAKLEKSAVDLEQALSQARQQLTASRNQIEQLSASLGSAVQSVERIAELETLLTDAASELEARDLKIAELSAAPPFPAPGAARIAELETLLTDAASELEARDLKIAELSAAPPAPVPAERIAELESLLSDAASELEARDQKIAELSAAPPSPAPAAGGISEELLLQLRGEIEATVQVEVERLHRDLDAFRKGNIKLRQELEAAQSGQAKPAGSPPPDVEPIQKENDELKARLGALEGDVQKLVQENEQFRASVRDLEEVRENLERETAQFNQQRHLLEEEVQALRKKVESGEASEPAAADPDLSATELMMEGDIVPEPDAAAEIDIEAPVPPLVPVDLTDGFNFGRQDAGLVAMQRQFQAEYRSLDLELSDPHTPREEREGVDLSEQKLTIDQLLVEVRKARAALTGKSSGAAVVVAAPQANRPKPRSTFQGLRRWLRGRDE